MNSPQAEVAQKMPSTHKLYLTFFVAIMAVAPLWAEDPGDTRPTVGLRSNTPKKTLLKDARVVVAPGSVLEAASILIDGSSIIAVGKGIEPPAGTEIIPCSGKTIYAGLIDGYSEIEVAEPPTSDASHWNGNVLPRRSAANAIDSISDVAKSRAQGITIKLVAPEGAIVKGSSCLVVLDQDTNVSLFRPKVAQHLQLTVPRDQRRDDYPNSPMGAIALLRQTLSDAQWYREAWAAYHARPNLTRPTLNVDLDQLADDRSQGTFIIDAQNERMALRADRIATEFTLNAVIRGSGREYRDAARIAATGRTLLIPVNFPEAPNVESEASADDTSLRDLMHWRFAPENPARLQELGAAICFTTDGLEDAGTFLKQVRMAVERGLDADQALAAMTTAPARTFGIDDVAGKIASGCVANLVITNGDLFAEDTNVLETWVLGKRFRHEASSDEQADALAQSWTSTIKSGKAYSVNLRLEREGTEWTGTLRKLEDAAGRKPDDEEENIATLNEITRAEDRFTAWLDLSKIDEQLPQGPSQLTIVTIKKGEDIGLYSTITFPDGKRQTLRWQSFEVQQDDDNEEDDDSEEDSAASIPLDEVVVNYPLGGYGVTEQIPQQKSVLFRGATVWTCGPSGILKDADVLIVDGKIQAVGKELVAPEGCEVVACDGKHITPGLIDCHSHMATDGGVNESGQAVTAEVRIGDFIDNSDINIYRQLAGGLTTSNILHGSANPIGGQNQVIKLRWGDSMEAVKFETAPQGIKFALGENVKRSNRSEPPTRYPASRMGVEQLFRDRFLAAREYDQAHRRWRAGNADSLPPRRDLELEAIAEILRAERWIHCHSYRQDEIVALLDLLDKFDVTIGTLQHILEGYKVADRMLEHGAMASAFSDWWAYKFEVYDAIPDNGAIMHDVGIVVSYNSDDRELARHLNTEAAKAVKYGGVPPEEALKFVTLNPAKQLRIDDRVGSLEAGKDADIVVWNGPPLSTLSRCEQTWVDGRLMFSLDSDRKLQERDRRWRSVLIRAALAEDERGRSSKSRSVEEEHRWLRYDEFCHGHDEEEYQDDLLRHTHQEVLR